MAKTLSRVAGNLSWMLFDAVVPSLKLSATIYPLFISLLESTLLLKLRTARSDYKIRRFLFSSESHQYINQSEGNMAIASTCLKYLCSDCFEPTLSDQDITDGIMRGAYVLQDYAVSHWLEHVIRAISKRNKSLSLEQISCDIEAMVERRENHGFERLDTGYVAHPSLKIFEAQTPELFKQLVLIHGFLQKRWSECSLANGKVLSPRQ